MVPIASSAGEERWPAWPGEHQLAGGRRLVRERGSGGDPAREHNEIDWAENIGKKRGSGALVPWGHVAQEGGGLRCGRISRIKRNVFRNI